MSDHPDTVPSIMNSRRLSPLGKVLAWAAVIVVVGVVYVAFVAFVGASF